MYLDDLYFQVRGNPETSEVEVEMSVQFDSKNYDDVDGDKAMPKQVCLYSVYFMFKAYSL